MTAKPKRPPCHDMSALFVVGGLYAKSNGVAWIMRDLAAALTTAGTQVRVYAADCIGRQSIGDIFEAPVEWRTAPGLWLGGLSWSPRLKQMLNDAVRDVSVVHNHSVWMLPNSYATRAAQRAGRPVVFTAHGALEPWALRHSGIKKRVVLAAFQRRDLLDCDCLHVNSEAEAAGVRAFGYRGPVAVIPNGVSVDLFQQPRSPEQFRSSFPGLRGRRVALFMARLHEKKGLGHLIPACANVASRLPDWHLVIAGPDCGAEASTRRLVEHHCLNNRVTFVGQLHGEAKLDALAAAELLVQPSFSEGFSITILEALAAGCPALITPGCNFPAAVESGGALEVPPTIEGTTAGLMRLLSLSPEELAAMGQRGRALVLSHYTWENVARQTSHLYAWLSGAADQPFFVNV
jgi:glycosyltransferase involved in cell wall biosynthesis